MLKAALDLGEKGPEAAGNEPVKPPPPNEGAMPGPAVEVLVIVKLAVDDFPTRVLTNRSEFPLAGVVLMAETGPWQPEQSDGA